MFGNIRVIRHALYRRLFSRPTRFAGSPVEICRTIIERLWNGKFYQTGLGHFNYFWIRDFGTVAKSLMVLGHHARVRQTLVWALARYRAAGRVTLCLDFSGAAFDTPLHSIDALPWLLYSLRAAEMSLTEEDRTFLAAEVRRFGATFIALENGLIRRGVRFSELRDTVAYEQSAYAITMLAVLVRDAAQIGVEVPSYFRRDYAAVLEQNYWNGSYINADLNNRAFSAEANLLPFWLGIITDPQKLSRMLRTIDEKGLSKPFPIHYTDDPNAFQYRWWSRLFMPNYAGSTIWTWHGALYLQLLRRGAHPAAVSELKKFETLIERHANFPELLHPDGRWYTTLFYRAGEGMVWCALYLEMVEPVPLEVYKPMKMAILPELSVQ